MIQTPVPLKQASPAAPPLAAAATMAPPPVLSVVIPTLNEAAVLPELLGRVRAALDRLGVAYEILVADGGSRDATPDAAQRAGVRVVRLARSRYGEALRAGLAQAAGEFVLTLDADLSHEPEAIERLWAARADADLVIASRYMKGGASDATPARIVLSRFLNFVFTRLLRLPVRDASSGFRLYRRQPLSGLPLAARDFDVIEEILIRFHRAGRPIREVPVHYRPRRAGRSHARLVRCGCAYLATLARMMRLGRPAK